MEFDGLLCFGSAFMALSSLSSQQESRISMSKGAFLMLMGFIYFIKLTDFLNKFLLETHFGKKFRAKYNLAVDRSLDISNKAISGVQAVYSVAAGFFMCSYSCTRDFLYSSHFISQWYACFGVGYFMYDIWSMYRVHISQVVEKMKQTLKKTQQKMDVFENLKDIPSIRNGQLSIFQSSIKELPCFFQYIVKINPLMTIHHLFIGWYGFAVITYLRGNLGDCMFSFVYIMESSTPFVSLRSILHTMGLKSSRIYVVNGLLMLLTFFVFRILVLPYGIYLYSDYANLSLYNAIHKMPTHCLISISLIFSLQVYWFALIVKGAIKLFSSKPVSTDVSSKVTN